MELVDLKWKCEIEGKTVPLDEIARRQNEVNEVSHPKWEAWRAKNYAISEEEMAKKLTRSYPHVRKDME